MSARRVTKIFILLVFMMLSFSLRQHFVRAADHLKISGTKCTECHDDLIKKKIVHPPAAAGCDTCHEYTEKGESAEVKLAAKGNELCFICHSEMQEAMKGKKFTHPPIVDLGCVTCHSPHSTDHAPLLKVGITQLCLSCHRMPTGSQSSVSTGKVTIFPSTTIPGNYPNKAKKVLIDSSYMGHPYANHPVSGVPEPKKKGKEMSCVSCHEAHFGNSVKMFKKDLVGQDLCVSCH
ncbi:MAG: cytochrome c3 family protein [Acidobacteria bacterium]|nr:cytochrome c3 family protein [Acidobacteriota bacterium]